MDIWQDTDQVNGVPISALSAAHKEAFVATVAMGDRAAHGVIAQTYFTPGGIEKAKNGADKQRDDAALEQLVDVLWRCFAWVGTHGRTRSSIRSKLRDAALAQARLDPTTAGTAIVSVVQLAEDAYRAAALARADARIAQERRYQDLWASHNEPEALAAWRAARKAEDLAWSHFAMAL